MQSTHNKIENEIKKGKRGKIIFLSDFTDYGTDVAVRHTFSRLCKSGLLIRLSAGIYLYPEIDKEIGIIYPSIEKIAKAIAKQEKARIIPTGAYALNALGLSTQVPMRVVFLTDGTPRMINIEGKASMKFKKTHPNTFLSKANWFLLWFLHCAKLAKTKPLPNSWHKLKNYCRTRNRKSLLTTSLLRLRGLKTAF